MAKKTNPIIGMFTGQEQPQAKKRMGRPGNPDDPIKPRGIGLRVSEWAELEAIAETMHAKTNHLAAWAIRDFVKRYKSGDLPTETKTVLKD
jgi:hypothetical protein